MTRGCSWRILWSVNVWHLWRLDASGQSTLDPDSQNKPMNTGCEGGTDTEMWLLLCACFWGKALGPHCFVSFRSFPSHHIATEQLRALQSLIIILGAYVALWVFYRHLVNPHTSPLRVEKINYLCQAAPFGMCQYKWIWRLRHWERRGDAAPQGERGCACCSHSTARGKPGKWRVGWR